MNNMIMWTLEIPMFVYGFYQCKINCGLIKMSVMNLHVNIKGKSTLKLTSLHVRAFL